MADDDDKIINIADIIFHPAIFKPARDLVFETYVDFCANNPVVLTYQDNRSRTTTSYTNECHRKSWLTMVAASYDSRDNDYTLSSETFEDNNMVIVDGYDLRFHKLLATRGSSTDIPDFKAIADKIQVATAGTHLVDVRLFVTALKNTDVDKSPLASPENKLFLKCNYAVMPNPMRRDFIMWVWDNLDNLYTQNFRGALDQFCTELQHQFPWRGRILNISMRRTPMESIFNHRQGSYPNIHSTELANYTRNALYHLKDHRYTPDESLLIVEGHLGLYTRNVQHKIFYKGGLSIDDLYRFEPNPY